LRAVSKAPNRGLERVALELPTILVVEDDYLIQSLAEDTLREGGFDTAVAASGEEALTLLQGHTSKYRALVTDINLQGKMDGWEVAQHAREIEPDFPVVYRCRGLDLQRRSKQHHVGQAICAGPASHCRF
jgi:CheY-like chemotaxis protein